MQISSNLQNIFYFVEMYKYKEDVLSNYTKVIKNYKKVIKYY